MGKTFYRVYDSTGAWLRTFSTYKEAQTFCISRGRFDWPIKQVSIK
jgi:hypothetical protein